MQPIRLARLVVVLLLGSTAVTRSSLQAQEAHQEAHADSLELRVRILEARVDSLLAVLADRREAADQPPADEEAELEALRAAARRAAEEGAAPDTSEPGPSRTRSLQALNPEISVTGDIVGSWVAPAGRDGEASATPREFEFSFQAALDPYTHTKIFVTREQDFEIAGLAEEGGEGDEGEEEHGGFEIEEGYMYWVGLPGGLGLKVGKFRQQIGLYNRWHTHALFEVERPLAAVAFLGEDGLIQTGAAVTLPALATGLATHTATFELTRGSNEALFGGGAELAYLGSLRSFWDLGAAAYVELGATGVYGENDDEALISRLLGLDATFRWAPAGRALYREFTLKGEWYLGEAKRAGAKATGSGGYLQANARLSRRWIAGLRVDYLDDPATDADIRQLVPSLTWWQSEWVRLRLQYNYLRARGGGDNHTLLFQTVWAMGPHKHETY